MDHGSKTLVERSHTFAMDFFSARKHSYSAEGGTCKCFTFHICQFAYGKLQLQHTCSNYGATSSLL